MSAPGNYVSKGVAVSLIAISTKRGRRLIESVLDKLSTEGKITITPDPIDGRAFLISRDDVEVAIKYINERGIN